ncbi:hypothetical protein JMUB6875_53610 [Nocardia sp. JMUB6875]|uniref:helix-hairpin-helix domain-containing protein n=1 Tax=Nocardia sp. JMUB6875 TaxID=3158170 RepID=UPI0032E53C3E
MSDPIWPKGVSAPAARALAAAGYQSLEQLAGAPERDLLALHGMGPKAIRAIRDALLAQGLDLAR